MQYIETSNKSVQEIVDTIKEVLPQYDFTVLNILNMKDIINSKGFNFKKDFQVVDVCNTDIASTFLAADMNLAPALPCKFTIYTKDNNTTYIVLNSLIQLIDELNPELIEIGLNAQEKLLKILERIK